MKLIRILFFTCLLVGLNAQAYYPKAEVDIKNTKLGNRKLEELDSMWFQYLQENSESLRPTGKKYTIDQSCRYTIESNENGDLLFDTIKLVKQKRENPTYNLEAINFLREQNPNLKKKKADKPLTIDFKYYAF